MNHVAITSQLNTGLVVAPNPYLDKTIILPGFEAGQISRPSEILTLAGGKGFNFARALHTSGCPAVVVAPGGGYQGRYFLN
jgi:fructose-1-phosphate kinase PfkB-like protein